MGVDNGVSVACQSRGDCPTTLMDRFTAHPGRSSGRSTGATPVEGLSARLGHRQGMELEATSDLRRRQSGVIARRQLVEGGADDADIRRWVRRRELSRVHPGVYVDHTGELSWLSRAWAAVLLHWPAVLCDRSVVEPGSGLVHVAVARERSPGSGRGIRVHRLADLDARAQWQLSPPRLRLEDALIGVASGARVRHHALALLVDACRRRVTTAQRLVAELERHPRAAHRAWLSAVLAEAVVGVHPMLESTYLRRVERAHALPKAERQSREVTPDGVVYRDAVYREQRLVVELDGRLGHELSHDRWDDQDRDLLGAGDDLLTLRLGWRHCESTPCRTALRLARVLRARGWRGRPRPCGDGCPIDP